MLKETDELGSALAAPHQQSNGDQKRGKRRGPLEELLSTFAAQVDLWAMHLLDCTADCVLLTTLKTLRQGILPYKAAKALLRLGGSLNQISLSILRRQLRHYIDKRCRQENEDNRT